MKKFKLFFVYAVSILFIVSCNKESNDIKYSQEETTAIEDRVYSSEFEKLFFSLEPKLNQINTRSGIDSFILRVNDGMYQLNQEEDFTVQLLEQYGVPDWSIGLASANKLLWVPLYKEESLNGLLGFVVINDVLYFRPFLKSYYNRLGYLVDNQNVQGILSIMNYFENGEFNFIPEEGNIDIRSCPPPPCFLVDVYDSYIDQWVLGVCECSGFYSPPGCCNDSGGPPVVDGGAAEAGGGIDINTWINLVNSWTNNNSNDNSEDTGDGGSSSPNSKQRVKLLRDLANEMYVLDWLLEYLDINIGEDGTNIDMVTVLAGNPQIANPIYLYLNGYYPGVDVDVQHVHALLRLLVQFDLNNNPPLNLAQLEIEHILTFEPILSQDILSFLDNHPNNVVAIQVVHDFLGQQMCTNMPPPCEVSDYENNFELVYNFYNTMTLQSYNWLEVVSLYISEYELNFSPIDLIQTISVSSMIDVVLGMQNQLGLSGIEVIWLLVNGEVATEVQSFLENNNLEFESSATEAARIYINLKVTDEEFSIFEEEFEDAPTWWFPFVKEIAKEAIFELLKRRVNGSLVGLPQDLIEAVDAISNGDILGVLGEALDIAKRFFPALQAVDTFLDGVELMGKGTRAWRAISKLKNFGEDVIQNVLSVVRQRAGGLLGKFKWGGNATGIKVLGISPSQANLFFDDLVALFPGAVLGSNPSNQNNIQYILPNGIILEYQPTSSTPGSGNVPSIQIKKNGFPTIKLRLNP